MLVAKPNVVLNHFFDHMGDKRSLIREDVVNIVMYALLTFPSNEFDLKVCIFLIYIVLSRGWVKKKYTNGFKSGGNILGLSASRTGYYLG